MWWTEDLSTAQAGGEAGHGGKEMITEKKAKKITEKIQAITKSKTPVLATYRAIDDSVQAELRLSADWQIWAPVDEIAYPRDLAGTNEALWQEMRGIAFTISKVKNLKTGKHTTTLPINEKTKTGPERRAEAKTLWRIAAGNAFLADYRQATSPRLLASIRKTITGLQSQQKTLLPKLREANSLYLAGLKSAKTEQNAKNTEALKSGRFWEADHDALKGYFHPPFDKNYLADVSEKWRAALFLECESVSYKGYNGDWRHKLSGTGDAYLCGIDDNGDEWGHRCAVRLSSDNYGNGGFDATVEEAMSDLFDIRVADLGKCQRQGDLLFCPETIPATTELHPEGKWTPRESHEITSPTLYRNGRYFRAVDEITVSHTSHAPVVLPAGEYRLYTLKIADAD